MLLSDYDLILAVPPYSAEDADHYGTPLVNRTRWWRCCRTGCGLARIWRGRIRPADVCEGPAAAGGGARPRALDQPSPQVPADLALRAPAELGLLVAAQSALQAVWALGRSTNLRRWLAR